MSTSYSQQVIDCAFTWPLTGEQAGSTEGDFLGPEEWQGTTLYQNVDQGGLRDWVTIMYVV
jgi:hypothetical protein